MDEIDIYVADAVDREDRMLDRSTPRVSSAYKEVYFDELAKQYFNETGNYLLGHQMLVKWTNIRNSSTFYCRKFYKPEVYGAATDFEIEVYHRYYNLLGKVVKFRTPGVTLPPHPSTFDAPLIQDGPYIQQRCLERQRYNEMRMEQEAGFEANGIDWDEAAQESDGSQYEEDAIERNAAHHPEVIKISSDDD